MDCPDLLAVAMARITAIEARVAALESLVGAAPEIRREPSDLEAALAKLRASIKRRDAVHADSGSPSACSNVNGEFGGRSSNPVSSSASARARG
jgi:hypothetical protein